MRADEVKEYFHRISIGVAGTQYLVRDPDRMFGLPTIEETRLPVSSIVVNVDDARLTRDFDEAISFFMEEFGRDPSERDKIIEGYKWGIQNPEGRLSSQ